jgi:tetratricopeptide (TPR) repeat protein
VQWTLGNFLLRQGKSEEAYAEIRKAAASDSQYANPAISGAWQFFAGNIDQMKQFVGNSANLKSAFAALLAREKRFGEALEVWDMLPETERKTIYKQNGEEIYQKMLEAKQYRNALELFSQLSDTERKFAVGRIENGSFELENPQKPSIFEWQIADGIEPQIGVDNSNKHEGTLSLVIFFNSSDGKSFRTVSQTIAVEADKKYVFEGFYKADLKTSATLKWEIVNTLDGKALASTEAVAAKTDWTNLKAEFRTSAETEGIILRLVRVSCNDACPISGKIWFDNFSLKN